MPNHTGRLILTTVDPLAAPDADLAIDALSDAGFIGSPVLGMKRVFAVGPRFLSLIAFTGCSVAIDTDCGEDGQAPCCQVRVLPVSEMPRFLGGRNTRPPRCPACRAPLRDWARFAERWSHYPQRALQCPHCNQTRPPWRWDWKEQGGFGRLFVAVEEVFPGEAVPVPALLDLLTRACGAGWRHFYVQD